jgi:hypothetical protein
MREWKFDLRTNERECWIVEIHILHATLLKSGYVAVLPFCGRKYVSKGIICNVAVLPFCGRKYVSKGIICNK